MPSLRRTCIRPNHAKIARTDILRVGAALQASFTMNSEYCGRSRSSVRTELPFFLITVFEFITHYFRLDDGLKGGPADH